MAKRTVFVFDTSAVLCLRSDEPGAGRVEGLLREAQRGRNKVLLSFMTRMELLYCIMRDEGEAEALSAIRLLESTRVDWVSCEPEILHTAAQIKASGGLSVADAWIAATALAHDAVLVHKDPEFTRVPQVTQELLRG
jgi:ribonuclease VapC